MSKIVDRIFNTVLTADDSTAQEELGAFRFENGKIYKYVYFADAVTAAAGAPCIYDGTYNYKVTVDLSLGLTASSAGVALTANTATYYGWIQIHGAATVKVTDILTAGDFLVASADGFWGVSATTTASPGAVMLESYAFATDGTAIAFIRCM